MARLLQNKGRQINFVAGIQGVAAGGNATLNMPTNMRLHRMKLQTLAVNYTGGTGLATTTLTGGGSGATVTPTVVNGQITAAAIVAGGAGYAVNDTLTVVDATGTGAIIKVTAVSTGAITTMSITTGGTASPINPATFFTGIKHLVNGVNLRDITPDNIIRIKQAVGQMPSLGELPIDFTEPAINEIGPNETFSWDLFGQGTYQVIMPISANVIAPQILGAYEFDYSRNTRPTGNGKSELYLNPVAQHQFTFNVAAGRNDINTLPISYPIRRLWILGATAGQIYQVELYQDGNKVLEATNNNSVNGGQLYYGQAQQLLQDYAFQFGRANYQNQNASATAVKGAFNPLSYFDSAFIADPDGRPWKALAVANQMILRVYSQIAQAVTIVMETLPGAFQS